jgi:lysophospholipase L1-like esterase
VGGSITEGVMVPADKSWASLLTAWLRPQYREVQARNLGIGATGSEFAAYRIERDLTGFVPDLVFLEFTVNDADMSRASVFAHVDALIFKLRRINPRVKIVYVSTVNKSEQGLRQAGRRADAVENAAAIAALNGIDFIDLGAAFWSKVAAGTPTSTYLIDFVHPTVEGYQLYFEQIRDAIDPFIPLPVQPSLTTSRLIEQSKLDNARLEPVVTATGCRGGSIAWLPYMQATLACGQGDRFQYRFSGTTIGLVRAMTKDGGRLTCTVDGRAVPAADFFDAWALNYDRSGPIILARDLAPGSHELACEVGAELITVPEGTSTGRNVQIGAFMVSNGQTITAN